MTRIGIAVSSLNQLALDFDGNSQRIIQSIKEAIDLGASVRVGPELEIPGYGCEDAFYEVDTTYHSWQVLAQIIEHDFKDILIDIGMPVLKDSALYNCRLLILNSQIVMIRPKTRLALNGNYRESRWFTAWDDGSSGLMVWYILPNFITALTGQTRVPFGDKAVLELTLNTDSIASASTFRIGFEICEELWHSDAQHVNLFGKRGCHLILNSSASYWEIRKLDRALSLMKSASFKSGGVYAFANLVGCDGGRLCFYGRSLVVMNGDLLTMTTDRQTMFNTSQTAIAYIDANHVIQYRLQNNIKIQNYKTIGNNLVFDAFKANNYNSNDLNIENIENIITININNFNAMKTSNTSHKPNRLDHLNLSSEQEIMTYCSLWLWDYLRRCVERGLQGFIVPLSGGLDSSSVVCLVYSLCTLLYEQIVNKNQQIIDYLKIVFKDQNIVDKIVSPKDICHQLLKCVYLSTRYSGADSYDRARSLAESVNSQFVSHNFDEIFKLIESSVPSESMSKPNDNVVSLQKQNIQARLRMVLTYYMSEGKRLVLATGNVDEALVGYLTKYDCSSADLNPIGSISKNDLKSFMRFCKHFIPESNDAINRIVDAIPSAELTGEDQKDEEDLGLTYDELSLFGKLRRGQFGTYGPFGMFCKIWEERHSLYIRSAIKDLTETTAPEVIAKKVKRFFTLYANNRHKQTVLTPALHSETYSPDDNRFDLRQFLLDSRWKFQFSQIDHKCKQINTNN